jgi:Cu(I)/Ag(I) efflux system membrane fusion protein
MPRGTPPARSKDALKFYFCPDHPEVLREQPGRCPHDQRELQTGLLAANQQFGWWCPMHVHMTADKPGGVCQECKGMQLVPRIVTYSPPGEVVAVPESAVLDTGRKKMVYIERMPGMFEGVEVMVGPRCGEFYPVVVGLEPGQRVATTGAFLIDAETRLNPSIAVGYFGAAQASANPRVQPPAAEPARKQPATNSVPPAKSVLPDLLKLPPADRDLAVRQKICPVTEEPLGSMGVPVKLVVEGKTVFLCCKGCERELRANAKKYLARLTKE